MAKNKLAKFAEMETYSNVFQSTFSAQSESNFELRGHWNDCFFKNDHPIILELGCGRGEYTIGLAKLYPEKNFIGVDIKGARMWTGATQALKENLSNVAFLRTNIEIIDRFFDTNEVSEIWLTFSDPQMKKVTKRLTSTHFMERYRHFLKDNGLIHLKTDSSFLFTYTTLMVEKNKLPVSFSTDDLYNCIIKPNFVNQDARILSIQTYYEQQWINRGINIKYLKFSLPAETVLTEPEVEIELDDYRSYNRSKRSGLETSK